MNVCESEGAAEDIDDTDEGRCIPFDGDSAVDFVVPEARTGNVESTVGFLHDDAVGDELEVFVDVGDFSEDLSEWGSTSSQI